MPAHNRCSSSFFSNAHFSSAGSIPYPIVEYTVAAAQATGLLKSSLAHKTYMCLPVPTVQECKQCKPCFKPIEYHAISMHADCMVAQYDPVALQSRASCQQGNINMAQSSCVVTCNTSQYGASALHGYQMHQSDVHAHVLNVWYKTIQHPCVLLGGPA